MSDEIRRLRRVLATMTWGASTEVPARGQAADWGCGIGRTTRGRIVANDRGSARDSSRDGAESSGRVRRHGR